MHPSARSRKPRRTSIALLVTLVLAATACASPASQGQPSADQSAPAPSTSTPVPTSTPALTPTPDVTPSPVATRTATPTATTVTIAGLSFGAPEITVAVGDLAFVNSDAVPHTVTEGQNGAAVPGARFDTLIAAGATVVVTLDQPGDVFITCQFHPEMQVLVHVDR